MNVENEADQVLDDVKRSACDVVDVREIFSIAVRVREIVTSEQTCKRLDKILAGIERLSASTEHRMAGLGQLAQGEQSYKELLSHLERFVRRPKSSAVLKAILADQDGIERHLSRLHHVMTEETALSKDGRTSFIRLFVQLSQDKADSADEYWGFRVAAEQFCHLLALQRSCISILRKVLMSKAKKGSAVDPRIERTTAAQVEKLDKQVELFHAEWKAKWDASAGASVFSWDSGQLLKGVRAAAASHGPRAADGDHIYFVARSSLYRLDAKGMAADGNATVELVCGGLPDLFADYVGGPDAANALSGLACGGSEDGGMAVYSWEAADLKRTDPKTRDRKTVAVLGENPRGTVLKRQSLVCQRSGTLFSISAGTLYRVDPSSSYDKREHSAGFTRDGCQVTADRSHVYVLDGDGNVWRADPAVAGRPSLKKVASSWHADALISSPVDSAYLYSLWDKTLYAIDKDTGVVTPVQSRRVWDQRVTVMVAHRMSVYLFNDEGNVYRVKGLWTGPTAGIK